MSNAKTVMSQAANTWAGPTYIEDVFSTYLYTGTGSALTITNGIDLAGEGGLVWIKNRSLAQSHELADTVRGRTKFIRTSTNAAERTSTSGDITSFNSSGFSLGASTTANVNSSGSTYASWTWRKAPRWFDVVTYTGDGVAGRQIAHNLGCEVGFMVVKCTSTIGDWYAYHRTLTTAPETDYIVFNDTGLAIDSNLVWNDTLPTSTHFTLGTNTNVNGAGKTFVAYLFAHDPLGPSGDGSDGLIACGTAGTNGTLTDLGWEPQWLLLRNTSSSGSNWIVVDNMRGVPTGGLDKQLNPNLSAAETDYSVDLVEFDPRGFIPRNAQSFRYIAIRRGPMRQPTSGTEVFDVNFNADAVGTSKSIAFPADLNIAKSTLSSSSSFRVTDRMRGFSDLNTVNSTRNLLTSSTAAEVATYPVIYKVWNNSFSIGEQYGGTSGAIYYSFRRAPGFFDVVTYTGDGVAGRTVSHNLGVAPEMMWVKKRNNPGSWAVYHNGANGGVNPENYHFFLEQTAAQATDLNYYWYQTTPTATDFTLGIIANVNQSTANTYIAYLFATLPGVSKVGSYTGNGSSQTINCGFTTGARFVLIKRTDSTGDWYVWDTARGIVAANDPHLSLNTTVAEVTTDDSIDPDSSGFIVNQVAATNINVSSASYIFYAIA